jgi:hypothetical protein
MAGRLVVNTLNTDTANAVFTTQNAVTGIPKAWVNFNGTGTIGASQTIRSSFNVSSVSKSNTGQYVINFTTAMPDANFTTVTGISRSYAGFDTADSNRILTVVAATTTTVSVQTTTPPTTLADLAYIGVAVLSS